MALGTTGSRATGLLRTVVLAWALGVGTLADAYNTANTAPNMLFALAAGGVLSSALVPLLAAATTTAEREEDASVVLGSVTVASAVVGLLMALGAPVIMRVLAAGAGGRAGEAELLRIGAQWMRMFALQIPFYAISVAAMGVLTAERRLTLGAAAGIATNVVTIAAAAGFVLLEGRVPPVAGVGSSAIAVLGWGTTAGVAAMALLQLWGARRLLPGLRFTPRLRHPAVGELRRLGGWMFAYVAVNQVGLATVIAVASAIDGGVSAYQWAFMVMQLPYAIVGVSLLSAAYPRIARDAASGDDVTPTVRRSAGATLTYLLPAAVGLALLADPISTTIIGRHAPLVAGALQGFAVSLVPFTLFQLLTRTSYAFRDTRTPALVNVWVNLVMVAVDVAVLALPLGTRATIAGLAIGHATSYVAGCVLLMRSLRRAGRVAPGAAALQDAGRAALATVPVAVLLLLWRIPADASRTAALGFTALAGLVGSAIYAAGLLSAPAMRGVAGRRAP